MRNSKLNKYFCVVCAGALLIGAQLVRAQETFQTHLLKTEVRKTSIGTIKVTLYTNKPYSDAITVNKKSNYEYVILMPETANTSTMGPSLATVSDTVRSIDIKTQQYEENVKGYTKIIIHTNKPAEITPQLRVIGSSESQLGDKDYKELLAQASKKKATAANRKSVAKKHISAEKQAVKLAPIPQQEEKPKLKPKTKIKKQIKLVTPVIEKRVKTPTKKVKKTVTKPKVFAVKPVTQKTVKKVQPKKIQPQIQPQRQPQSEVKPQQQPQQTPEVVKTAPIPEDVANKTDISKHPDVITPQEPKQAPQVTQPAAPKKLRKIEKIKNIVKKGIKIVEANLYTTLGLVAAMLIVMLLIARKASSKSKKQQELFKTKLEEKPTTKVDYAEKINEDMNWREKFQTYVETTKEAEAQTQPDDLTASDMEDLDDLFKNEQITDEDLQIGTSFEQAEEISEEEQHPGIGFEEIQDYSTEETEASVDDLFSDEIAEEFEEEAPEAFAQEEEDELVKSEFAIDNQKGFYLVDFEDKTALVGHIEDEIFVLKNFDEKIEAPLQARLNEKHGDKTSYMTKVGNFKGMVEVTPEKMSLLIEL